MSARLAKPPKAMNPAGLPLVPLFLCFAVSGCGPINVHVFENVGKHGLETRATDDGLQTRPTESDPSAKVKLLLAGEVAPWDGVLITRVAFDAMADAANGTRDGLQTRATDDGLQTRPTK